MNSSKIFTIVLFASLNVQAAGANSIFRGRTGAFAGGSGSSQCGAALAVPGGPADSVPQDALASLHQYLKQFSARTIEVGRKDGTRVQGLYHDLWTVVNKTAGNLPVGYVLRVNVLEQFEGETRAVDTVLSLKDVKWVVNPHYELELFKESWLPQSGQAESGVGKQIDFHNAVMTRLNHRRARDVIGEGRLGEKEPAIAVPQLFQEMLRGYVFSSKNDLVAPWQQTELRHSPWRTKPHQWSTVFNLFTPSPRDLSSLLLKFYSKLEQLIKSAATPEEGLMVASWAYETIAALQPAQEGNEAAAQEVMNYVLARSAHLHGETSNLLDFNSPQTADLMLDVQDRRQHYKMEAFGSGFLHHMNDEIVQDLIVFARNRLRINENHGNSQQSRVSAFTGRVREGVAHHSLFANFPGMTQVIERHFATVFDPETLRRSADRDDARFLDRLEWDTIRAYHEERIGLATLERLRTFPYIAAVVYELRGFSFR